MLGLPGRLGAPDRESAIAGRYLPNRVLAHFDPDRPEAVELPLLRGKALVRGQAALYICRNYACAAPVTDPSAATAALASLQGLHRE